MDWKTKFSCPTCKTEKKTQYNSFHAMNKVMCEKCGFVFLEGVAYRDENRFLESCKNDLILV